MVIGDVSLREQIRTISDKELEDLILARLIYRLPDIHTPKHDSYREGRITHLRFDMSGYGADNSCNIHNNKILQAFADFGIYDSVEFLSISAYKGEMSLYYQWHFGFRNDMENTIVVNYVSYLGWGTREIIKDIILRLSINNHMPRRRFD